MGRYSADILFQPTPLTQSGPPPPSRAAGLARVRRSQPKGRNLWPRERPPRTLGLKQDVGQRQGQRRADVPIPASHRGRQSAPAMSTGVALRERRRWPPTFAPVASGGIGEAVGGSG